MSEDTVEEIVTGTAIQVAPTPRPLSTLVSPVGGAIKTGQAALDWFQGMAESYNSMPDDIKDALILMQRPFPVSGGGATFLTPPQAMMIVRYCREKSISVHADHWWFDVRNCKVGSTTAGQRETAAKRGIKHGPPQFTITQDAWPQDAKPIAPFTRDLVCTCKMETPSGPFSITVRLSRCAKVGKDGKLQGGPWSDDPENMLQIRAEERCLKRLTGGEDFEVDPVITQ